MNALTSVNLGDALVSQSSSSVTPAPRDKFNYADLVDDEMAAHMRDAANSIHRRMRGAVIDTGRDLLRIKLQLDHGMFTQWIKDALGMNIKSAENYMAAAELVDKNEQCSILPVEMVNAFVRAPDAMRPTLIDATADGSITKAKQIRDRVQEQRLAEEYAKLEAQRAAAEANVTPRTKKARAERLAEEARQEAERKAEARVLAQGLLDRIGEAGIPVLRAFFNMHMSYGVERALRDLICETREQA